MAARHDGTDPSDEELRARRRAFIRASHPDAGGDPDAFIAGLAEFDRRSTSGRQDSRASVYRSRRPDRMVRQTVRELRRRWQGKPPRNLQ